VRLHSDYEWSHEKPEYQCGLHINFARILPVGGLRGKPEVYLHLTHMQMTLRNEICGTEDVFGFSVDVARTKRISRPFSCSHYIKYSSFCLLLYFNNLIQISIACALDRILSDTWPKKTGYFELNSSKTTNGSILHEQQGQMNVITFQSLSQSCKYGASVIVSLVCILCPACSLVYSVADLFLTSE
jgi:hypothetical protein